MIEGAVMELHRKLQAVVKERKQRAKECHEKGWDSRYHRAATEAATAEVILGMFKETMGWK